MPEPAPSSLAAWNAGLDARPLRDPRSIGRWMIWLGSAAIMAGMFLTPPWGNIGLGVGFAGVLLARAPLHRLGVTYAGLAFVVWLLLSVAAGMIRGEPHSGKLPGVVHTWLSLPLVAAAAVDPRWRRFALRALIVAGAVAGVVALLQFTIGFGHGFLRIDPEGKRFKIANGFSALHLTLGFAGALLAAVASQPATILGLGGAWAWAGRVIGVVVFSIAGSRAALVGGIAGVAAGLTVRGRRWLLVGFAVGLVLAGLALGRMAVSDPNRLRRMFAGDDGRWPIWATSLVMVEAHPVVGMGGRDVFMFAYNETFARTLPGKRNEFGATDGCAHAHSWLLALAAEHGLPAVVLHLTLVGGVLVVCRRRRHVSPACWSTAVAVATTGMVAGLFEPFPTQAVPGAAFHACLGFALGLAYANDQETTT